MIHTYSHGKEIKKKNEWTERKEGRERSEGYERKRIKKKTD